VFVTPVIEKSPTKVTEKSSDESNSDTSGDSASEDSETATKPPNPEFTKDAGKRTAQASPGESSEKKKKMKKKKSNPEAVRSSSRNGTGQSSKKS